MGDATKSLILRDAEVRAVLAGRATVRRRVRPMRGGQSRWLTDEFLNAVPSMKLVHLRNDMPKRWANAFGAQMEHPKGGPGGWVECPFGAVGERRWVRECWARVDFNVCADGGMSRDDFAWCTEPDDISPNERTILYRATAPDFEWNDSPESHWNSATQMPRWASRLTVQIVAVRVELGANGWVWVVEIERCANG